MRNFILFIFIIFSMSSVYATTILFPERSLINQIKSSDMNLFISGYRGEGYQYTLVSTQYLGCWNNQPTCTVSGSPWGFDFSFTLSGAPDFRPFSSVAFTQNTCSLNLLIGTANSGWTGKSFGVQPEMQNGSGGMLYWDSPLKTINKRCSDVTVSDIGFISGHYDGYAFYGPVAFSGNPSPLNANEKILAILAVYDGSSARGAPTSSMWYTTDLNAGSPPSIPVSCNLLGELEINHGTLSPQSVPGSVSKTDLQLQCSRDATATIDLVIPGGESKLNLGGGVFSSLSVLPKKTISVESNKLSNFSIRSTLSSVSPVIPGDHSGNVVLFLSYQ